jgi:hypothetical protein
MHYLTMEICDIRTFDQVANDVGAWNDGWKDLQHTQMASKWLLQPLVAQALNM